MIVGLSLTVVAYRVDQSIYSSINILEILYYSVRNEKKKNPILYIQHPLTANIYEKCRHQKPTQKNRNRFLFLEVFFLSHRSVWEKNQNLQNQKPIISVLVFGFWWVFDVDIFRIMSVLVQYRIYVRKSIEL